MKLEKPSTTSMLLVMSIFMASLINYGPLVIVLSCLLFVFVVGIGFTQNNLITIFILLLYSLISLVTLFFYPDNTFHQVQIDSSFANYLNISFLSLFSVIFYQGLSKYPDLIYKCIGIVVKLHCIIWVTQVIVYSGSSYYLDLHGWFTGESSRYLTQGISDGFLKYRFTGITVEPSTYATTIILLVLSRVVLSEVVVKKTSRKIDKYDVLAIATAFFTFSTAAMFYSLCAFFIIYAYKYFKKEHIIFIALSLIIITPVLFFVFKMGLDRFDEVSGIRFSFLNYIFFTREDYFFWFGSNLFALEKELYIEVFNLAGEARTMASVNDSGVIPFLMTFTGIFGLVIVVILLLLIAFINLPVFFCVAIVLLTKISIYHCLFFIFICSAIFSIIEKNYHVKNSIIY
ncbi:hypothetical protein [Vibrio natriegens]|uniref:hypothetical protein n=1 Tax=Vibrio natriegens TaxID=691 RepID=UPI001FB9BA7D|nr:hypothetical protein [Vibrio natriegens]